MSEDSPIFDIGNQPSVSGGKPTGWTTTEEVIKGLLKEYAQMLLRDVNLHHTTAVEKKPIKRSSAKRKALVEKRFVAERIIEIFTGGDVSYLNRDRRDEAAVRDLAIARLTRLGVTLEVAQKGLQEANQGLQALLPSDD